MSNSNEPRLPSWLLIFMCISASLFIIIALAVIPFAPAMSSLIIAPLSVVFIHVVNKVYSLYL